METEIRTPGEQEARADSAAARRPGGLYAKVKLSVRAANWLVAIGIAALVAVTAFTVRHNGFTVTYDSNGGSYVESSRVMHSETVSPENPVREGYVFTGWYLDRDCSVPFSLDELVVGSMTLYAGWQAVS